MAKDYFIKFVPRDWFSEPSLRQVTLSARGLWMDMLCIMHESPRRGFLLQANGTPITNEQLARLAGCSAEEAAHLLGQLEDAGVFSRDGNDVIYNRRMVNDERIRESRVSAGRKGGFASVLLKQNVKQTSSKGSSKTQALDIRSQTLEVRRQTSEASPDDDPAPQSIPELDDLPWFSWAFVNGNQRNALMQYAREYGGAAVRDAMKEAKLKAKIPEMTAWINYAKSILTSPKPKPKHELKQDALAAAFVAAKREAS